MASTCCRARATPLWPCSARLLPCLQRAVKIEKRIDVRTVRQEYKVLKRLQAGCRQAVRVHEGGEYAGGCCHAPPPVPAHALPVQRRLVL